MSSILRRLSPVLPSLLLLAAALPAHAQDLSWRTLGTFYGDDTEFFGPYREGETIFGAQVTSWLAAQVTPKVELRGGVFLDRRWGSERFMDSVKPVLSLRYTAPHTFLALGTLETQRRHGFLEPQQVTTLELTHPIEYGLQWIQRHDWLEAEVYLDWQKLNTPTQREQFTQGTRLMLLPRRWVAVEGNSFWYHRGGQLFNAGVPATNNRTYALGLRLQDTLPGLGPSALWAYRLWSVGQIDPAYPADRPTSGHGTYLRASASPIRGAEFFVIWWKGRDYVGDLGDNNYNSTGVKPDFYRSGRRYTEIGVLRRRGRPDGLSFDAEARIHKYDDVNNKMVFGQAWELSFRVVARVPVDVVVRRRAPAPQ